MYVGCVIQSWTIMMMAAQETTISGREGEARNCRGSSPLGCAWRAVVRERELQIMTSSERYTSRLYRS